MSALTRILILFVLTTSAAAACPLDDCVLPPAMHNVDGKAAPAHGLWTWLHHDLALARDAATRNVNAKALDIAHNLDHVLRARSNELIEFSGTQSVIDFHLELQSLVHEIGAWPLAELGWNKSNTQG